MKKFYYAEFWNLMKICAAQGFIAVLFCGIALAHESNGQILDREISLDIKEVSFSAALHEISISSGAYFSYSPDLVKVDQPVTIKVERQTLSTVLNDLLGPYNIRYTVDNDNVTISLKPGSPRRQSSIQSNIRIDITGAVKDATGQPMPGVNVVIKGSSSGTTTDNNGRYSLNAEPDDIIVFSFIGYASTEERVGNRTTIDIVLTEDVTSLDEVVINVGYWEVKQREQTGNVARVTAEEIQRQPINNPLQSLQGRMAGVYIQQNTGMPGGGFKIQIRGQNSLRTGAGNTTNGNLPMYIVDGIPFSSSSLTSPYTSSGNLQGGNPLSIINPNDIESIEVLKDADATSIYGSRGANGVVLITTKKAKPGRTKFNVELSQGVGQVARKMDLLNSQQYLEMRREALKNDNYLPLLEDPANDFYWPDLKVWDTTRYTDWQKVLIGGTAKITNAQGSISGGNLNTQFSLSGGFYKETTVFPGNNDFVRGSGRFNLNHTSENKKFNATLSLNYTTSVSDIPSLDFTSQAVTLAPVAPTLRTADGRLNWENGTWVNPLADLERKYRSDIDNFIANTTLSYEILPGLTAKTNLGYTSMYVTETTINPLSALDPSTIAGNTGSSVFANRDLRTWIAEPQLSYVRKIGMGDLSFLLGSTFQQSLESGRAIQATGYTNDALLENIDAATGTNVMAAAYTKYRYAAGFARLNYNWDGKYIVNLTGRRDGSSRFGIGSRFANFGAIGAAWIFSNENFFSNSVKFMSFGKLRASYGTTGSDAIGNYQYLDTYASTSYPYNGVGGLVISRLNNPDYSWETNRKAEFGTDFGFAKDRILFSAAFYFNQSSNQLVGLPLPAMTGQTSVQFNLPAVVENSGWEFQLSTTNVSRNKFEWTSNFNLTIPDNVLKSFPGIENFPYYGITYQVGQSLYALKALEYAGIDPQTGIYTFADRDNDGAISTTLDIIARKEINQQCFGGLTNSFTYGGVRLDIFFQFVKQTGRDYRSAFNWPGTTSNQPVEVMNRWRNPGDEAGVQKFSAFTAEVINAYFRTAFSDDYITDASFIRLKNVSLSWQLPTKWASKIAAENIRLSLQGQNLLTFTKYKGMDPETMSSSSLPPLRVVTAGIQFTF